MDKLLATNADLAALLSAAAASDLQKPAEAPPGHLTIAGVCAHALWDAWVHERDVLLPLGRVPDVVLDELAIVLAYGAAIGPACYVNSGEALPASLVVRGRNPDLEMSVDVSDVVTVRRTSGSEPTARIAGDSIELIESLCCRGPMLEGDNEHRWLVDGLSKLFNPEL